MTSPSDVAGQPLPARRTEGRADSGPAPAAADTTPAPPGGRLRDRAGRPRPAVPRRVGRPAVFTALLASGAFAASLLLQATLYRHGSGDADEAAYVLQAKMLLDGRLTLATAEVEPFFRPWLTGEVDGRVFTKYLPGWPAALAASQLLFGTMAVAPAAVAAAWVAGAYRLGRELFDDVTGAVAAVFVACSPLVLLHTALPLAYAFTAAMLTLACAALLRGARTGGRLSMLAGGAGIGVALLTRPFDAVLVALPCAVLVLTRVVRSPSAAGRLRQFGRPLWAVAGVAPFAALLLAYCAHVTGSPLRLPLAASDPLDRFGFGERRILPGQPTFMFTRRDALDALFDTLAAAPSWLFGGVVLAAFAVVGLLAPGRLHLAGRGLAAATVFAVLAGYFFWWGSAFAVPGLVNGLGPHYHLAAFTPGVLLAALGVRWLWAAAERALPPAESRGWRSPAGTHARAGGFADFPARFGQLAAGSPARAGGFADFSARFGWWRPVAAVAVAVAMVATTAAAVPGKVAVQQRVNEGTRHLYSLLPDDLPTPAAVLVTPPGPSRYTQVPYHTLRNEPDLSGPVVFAADLGAASVGLPDATGGRALFRLRPGELLDPGAAASFRGGFVALRSVEGRQAQVRVNVGPPGAPSPGSAAPGSAAPGSAAPGSAAPGSAAPGSAAPGPTAAGTADEGAALAGRNEGVVYVRLGVRTRVLPAVPTPSGSLTATFTISNDKLDGPDRLGVDNVDRPSYLVVGYVDGQLTDTWARRWEERIPLGATASGGLRLLIPGLGWQLVPQRHGDVWQPAPAGGRLSVHVVAAP